MCTPISSYISPDCACCDAKTQCCCLAIGATENDFNMEKKAKAKLLSARTHTSKGLNCAKYVFNICACRSCVKY